MALEPPRPTLDSIGLYDLVEKIAEGGMGTVYKGRHRQTNEIVAVKVVAPHMLNNPVLLKRFEQEYNTARLLNHPNIVRAIEYGLGENKTPFLVMEFVEGKSLGQKLEQYGPMSERDAIILIAQVAQALHKAHKEGLVHRDVKPDNILVTPDGQAKLADLGLVKEIDADLNLTRTGRGLGTPHFMAPEQFKNAKNVDQRCDIYSLGATLYMMVTGEMPFKSSGPLDAYLKKSENKLVPPREVVPTLTERIDWAIRRSMSADPDKRPASCREFVEDLTGKSTRKVTASDQSIEKQQDLWYLWYQDEEGKPHVVKGGMATIRRTLKEGLLGDVKGLRASRTKEGSFLALETFPEFRDLVITPATLSSANVTMAKNSQSSTSSGPGKSKAASTMTTPSSELPTLVGSAGTVERSRPIKIDIAATPSPSPGSRWPLWLKCLLLIALAGVSTLAGLVLFRK